MRPTGSGSVGRARAHLPVILMIHPGVAVDEDGMYADAEKSSVPPATLPLAERTFRAFAPHLWPWTGWYALIVADRFVGVFPTLWDAITAAQSGEIDPDAVLVRRIGGDSAVAAPIADGGRMPSAPPWSA